MVDIKQLSKKEKEKENDIIAPTCKEQQLKFFIYYVKSWMEQGPVQ